MGSGPLPASCRSTSLSPIYQESGIGTESEELHRHSPASHSPPYTNSINQSTEMLPSVGSEVALDPFFLSRHRSQSPRLTPSLTQDKAASRRVQSLSLDCVYGGCAEPHGTTGGKWCRQAVRAPLSLSAFVCRYLVATTTCCVILRFVPLPSYSVNCGRVSEGTNDPIG